MSNPMFISIVRGNRVTNYLGLFADRVKFGHDYTYVQLGLGYVQAHPAETLREMLRAFLCSVPDASGINYNNVDDWLTGPRKRDKIPFFGRSSTELQQSLGTEWGRNQVHFDIWVRILDAQFPKGTAFYNDSIRFPNEAGWIRSRGGLIFLVVDPRKRDDGDEHISEHAWASIVPDQTIINDGDLIKLHRKTLLALESALG